MAQLNDLGNRNLKELSRVYNIEINTPYIGGSNIILKREKLFLVDNSVVTQTQLSPIVKNSNECAKSIIKVFDPVTGKTIDISVLALISAIQQAGQ
jgi:hypothetical protein